MKKEKRYQTTKKGFDKLVEELKFREKELRSKIADTLNEMRNQGDLRENDGYSMAVENQQINEEKIMNLKEKIQDAEIIRDKNKNVVGIGDIVTLENGKKIRYEVTSEDEANPLERKISHKSPIGTAIIGKKVGEKVKIDTPKGKITYCIEKIA
jgi:transcription elongation factor GreA